MAASDARKRLTRYEALHSRPHRALFGGEIILRCYTEVAFAGRLFLFWTTRFGRKRTDITPLWRMVGRQQLEAKLAAIIAPRLELMGFELVRVAVLGRERPTVQVMADRADGSQITVEDCEQISHDVSAAIDVEDPIPGAWTLGGQFGRHRSSVDPDKGLEPLCRPPRPR